MRVKFLLRCTKDADGVWSVPQVGRVEDIISKIEVGVDRVIAFDRPTPDTALLYETMSSNPTGKEQALKDTTHPEMIHSRLLQSRNGRVVNVWVFIEKETNLVL